MTTTSKDLIAWRDRILDTPKHLREFEEVCALRSIDSRIKMAQGDEYRAREAANKIKLNDAAFHALIATANYAKGVESRKSLLHEVSELYSLLSDLRYAR